jgi:hypothetical protein
MRCALREIMRAFMVGCIAAAVIALCAVAVLNIVQKPAELAFKTEGVRL